MALFNKKKKVPVAELKIRELYKSPREQILSLQKRFDHLQDLHINTSTHLGELKLNAEGEITRIELFMEVIKTDMSHIRKSLTNLDHNMEFLITDLNMTARKDDLNRFNQDLERLKPFNYMTVKQFDKLVKDMVG